MLAASFNVFLLAKSPSEPAVPHRAQTVSQNFTLPLPRHIIALPENLSDFPRFFGARFARLRVSWGKRAGAA
jgi:hypothetical protein